MESDDATDEDNEDEDEDEDEDQDEDEDEDQDEDQDKDEDEDKDKDKDEDQDKDKDEDEDQEDQPSAGTSYGPNLTANPSHIIITPCKFQSAEFDMLPMQLFDLNLRMIAEESENGD